MAKQPATIFVCSNCGGQQRKWLGRCPDCGEFNTLVEERFRPTAQAVGKSAASNVRLSANSFREVKPISYSDIESQDDMRTSSGIEEFDRVLGGGIVAGSLVLIGGSPGIGKSTIVIQMADKLSQGGGKVLYVSGEESERQIKMRGERLGINAENLFLLPETNLENILAEVEKLQPDFVIVDSIQTVFSEKIESAPGSVSQVRDVAGTLMIFAKQTSTPVFLIGHVTKEGSIAGPKALEHIVDTVLYFEGDRHHNHRIIRATKNRFGAANEIGIFEMTGEGLKAVGNPSEVFLQERPEGASGSVVTVCMEGTRPMLVEVQALVTGTKFGTGRRMAQGFDYNRTSLLIAVLEKRVGFQLANDDVFINVAGGLEIDEPAADLGVIAAIASSFRNLQIPPDTAVFGEVGLTGEVRGVLQAETRAREAQTLGFKKLILPMSNKKGLEKLLGMRVVGVKNLEEALDELFTNDNSTQTNIEKSYKEKIDWVNLGKLVGTSGNNLESVSTQDAQKAIEILIGEENLREAVDYYIDGRPGCELARFVLRQFHPWSAMEYCYEIYKSDKDAQRRMFAVELLRAVADKRALQWIDEFLDDNDPQIQVLGIGILDYLNLKNLVFLEDVEEILSKATKHLNLDVREAAKMIGESLFHDKN